VDLPIRFPTGEDTPFTFFVTPLDSTCSLVLGLNWLTRYNPLIDWELRRLTFRTPSTKNSIPTSVSSGPVPGPETLTTPAPIEASAPPVLPVTPPHISLIGAAAFVCASKLPGSKVYRFQLSTPEVDARSASTSDPINLSNIPEEYHDFADVFSKSRAEKIPEHRPYDLKIDLEPGQSIPPGPMYSLSPLELQTLRDFIDKHLSIGLIRPTSSPHGAPVLFIKKKDGSLRLCVDYRALNRITRKDRYPLPLTADLLDAPRKARVYTKIDLRTAYHLLRVAEGDEWKTVFRTRYGSYEWLVVIEGLTNAPAAFQHFMNDIFADMLDVSVIVYLDDILIYSDNMDDHRKHVREVLRRLRHNGLYAKPEKCSFHTDSVDYLGFILSPEGLTMDQAKVKVIQDWPEPRRVKDVQSFLGFANFYRRFINDYAKIVIPLTRLTRKSIPFQFSEKAREAFVNLKNAFTTAPILSHWIPEAPIIVETDASDYAIAAILSIITPDEEVHPVAFYSRSLSTSELNYDTHDKELLAIFAAFTTWRHYLEGPAAPVDVVTDHKNLEYFSSTRMLTRRQARWSEYLSQFNFIIRFRPGKLGAKPDALTRRWDVYPKEGDSDYASVNPQNFRPVFTSEQLASSLRASTLAEPVIRAAVVMDEARLHEDILSSLPNDPIALEKLNRAKSDDPDPRWTLNSEGLLCKDNRIYVPDSDDLRLRVLQYKHDHILAGHFGQNKTITLIRRQYTWPGLRSFVINFCKSCTTCARAKAPRHKPYGTLQQLPIPEQPWNSISMDFIEKLPESSGYTAILVVVDRLTKQTIFIPTHDTITSPQLAELFVLHVFSKHGVPSHVTSDRGSEFVSHFFRSLGKALDMRLHFTSGYHPEGDGQTERMNQTLEQYLRIYCNYQQDNWSSLLPLAEFAYNNALNATTGISPFFANKGYHPNITVHPERDLSSARARDFAVDLDQLHQELRLQIAAAQKCYQGPADSRRTPSPDFQIGQEVLVRSEYFRSTRPSKKLSDKYFGPYPIIAQVGKQSYTLRLPDSMRAVHPVFHVSQLEPSVRNIIPNRVQPPPPPVEIDGEPEFEISEILDSKIDNRRRTCKLLYLVRWSGYEGTDEETSWILATELEHASELVSDFHSAYPAKPGPSLSSI